MIKVLKALTYFVIVGSFSVGALAFLSAEWGMCVLFTLMGSMELGLMFFGDGYDQRLF